MLSVRIARRLAPHVPGAEAIEVRTLHALARQVLLDAGRPVRLARDRVPLLRAARRRALAELRVTPGDDPPPEPPDSAALDTIVSAWKIEGRTPPPEAAATVDAFAALMAIVGQIDFDDLVVGAVAALEGRSAAAPPVAGPLQPPVRRQVLGRRRRAAAARPPSRGAGGQPSLSLVMMISRSS